MKHIFCFPVILFLAIGFFSCSSSPKEKIDIKSVTEETLINKQTQKDETIEAIEPFVDLSMFSSIEIPEDLHSNLIQAIRFLSENEKVYLSFILEKNENGLKSFLEYLNYEVKFNDTKVFLSDFYVKIEKDNKYYKVEYFISYPKTQVEGSNSFYNGQDDRNYGFSSMSIPTEADRGGMNANFVPYDYITEYNFLKNYPQELLPLIELCKEIGAKVDYDFKAAYGAACKIRSGQQGAICDGYADYATNYFIANKNKLPGLTEIYKINSSVMNHAWNEVVIDGKTVYVDTTWFDINQIGDDGYSVTLPQDWNNSDWDYNFVTYDQELFSKGYSGKVFSHYAGNDTVKTLVWEAN